MIEQRAEMMNVRTKDEAAGPPGDFIAMTSSAVAALFTFLGFFQTAGGAVVKGYETPYGAVMLTAAAICFMFSGVTLGSRFVNPESRLARSPGWMYFLASSVIIITSVAAMVLGFQGYANEAGPIMTMVSGLFIGFGGIMKF
jgi:hypothetical protein